MLHLPELLPDELMGGYLGRIGRINGINKVAYASGEVILRSQA